MTMNANQTFELLLAERAAFDERTKNDAAVLEQETRRVVTSKLNYLAGVGHRVLTKKLGHGWQKKDLTYLGDIGVWLTAHAPITNITADKIEFTSEALKSRRPSGKFYLERRYLHMSDREFAKILRTAIYARKAHLKKVELYDIENSIKRIQTDIANKTQELARLANLVKDEEKRLEAKVQENADEAAK
jgi:hypothetical protein